MSNIRLRILKLKYIQDMRERKNFRSDYKINLQNTWYFTTNIVIICNLCIIIRWTKSLLLFKFFISKIYKKKLSKTYFFIPINFKVIIFKSLKTINPCQICMFFLLDVSEICWSCEWNIWWNDNRFISIIGLLMLS